jgi:uncharacterized membrane protein YeaQ/YmgE (transglycosylase-associated protein family)
MGIIGWIAIGAVAGIIAKALYPGAESFGIVLTILLGTRAHCSEVFAAWLVGAGDPIDEFFGISTWLASIIGRSSSSPSTRRSVARGRPDASSDSA